MKNNTGLYEWVNRNINSLVGCSNNCKYCYAECMNQRFEIETEVICELDVNKIRTDYMEMKQALKENQYPSSYDITDEYEL